MVKGSDNYGKWGLGLGKITGGKMKGVEKWWSRERETGIKYP